MPAFEGLRDTTKHINTLIPCIQMDSSILVGNGYSEWTLDKISKPGRTSASEDCYNLSKPCRVIEDLLRSFV